MASLDRRADKQQRKPAHAQERTQAREVVPATPQPPPDAKAPEPESQTPQDKLGAVLMALAGRTPDAMPQALAWTRAGAVTVLPQREHAVLPQAEVRARWLDQPPGRADAVLQALTGAIGHAVPTRDPAALWMALRAAIAAGQTVLAGGDDDAPARPHARGRVALVTAAALVEGQPIATILAPDGAEQDLSLAEFCSEFSEIAIAVAE